MIEQDKRMHSEVVGAINTTISELIKDNSSIGDGSIPGLQERPREYLFSNDETGSCDDDGIYEDGEP